MSRKVRLFIEGGGRGKQADLDFRRSWRKFLNELHACARSKQFDGLDVVRGRSRKNAFDLFVGSAGKYKSDLCILLVDAETHGIAITEVWNHVRHRPGDGWVKPNWASESHLYFMVATVETWLITDQAALQSYFGKDFDASKLPTNDLETRSKADINSALERATRNCRRGKYKHADGNLILEEVDPSGVKKLTHGSRLFEGITDLINAS